MTETSLSPEAEHLLRDLAPHVLGAVVRRFRDFAASEDAVQEALAAAAEQWPQSGIPENPRGWLLRVASRRMVDHVRSEASRRRREAVVATEGPPVLGQDVADGLELDSDDTLILLFMCCHPALSPASAIGLTLRAVGGLTTEQIARAFLVPTATMAQRISRAKEAIRASGVSFERPDDEDRSRRLGSVLHVLYLMFNEGYTTSVGTDLRRPDLSTEAIRLTRAVYDLCPGEGEVEALLALMLLTDARHAARTGPDGALIPLDEQDRSLWDREAIREGIALARTALSRGSISEYHLLAAIAAVHDEAARAEDTDWPEILTLYDALRRVSDSPMVVLNHAIAIAMVRGPRAGLELVAALDADGRLRDHHRLYAVRAHLLERAGEPTAAISQYLAAAERTTSGPERDYLLAHAARLSEAGKQPST